ncbi:hypothetical protein [Kitasatospora nipponensis]|uniref:hypothetical protein n=1 Tax=Kitasatospora nipponensis TaxID=258049 RepID=UPI0031DC7A32
MKHDDFLNRPRWPEPLVRAQGLFFIVELGPRAESVVSGNYAIELGDYLAGIAG